jgi:hypothetical protein
MKRLLLAVPVILVGLAATGCAERYGYGYVRVPPPPMRHEYYGRPPSPGHVWIEGYWGWNGGRYNWTPGYWARPPRSNARWQAGRWESTRHGYQWHAGSWR